MRALRDTSSEQLKVFDKKSGVLSGYQTTSRARTGRRKAIKPDERSGDIPMG